MNFLSGVCVAEQAAPFPADSHTIGCIAFDVFCDFYKQTRKVGY